MKRNKLESFILGRKVLILRRKFKSKFILTFSCNWLDIQFCTFYTLLN